MRTKPNFCIDCIHYSSNEYIRQRSEPACTRDDAASYDLVTGNGRYATCSAQRASDSAHACGPDARFYKAGLDLED